MKAVIRPSQLNGSLKIPPSKSMAHRAIICACLANGKSVLSNIDYSQDILATIDCMKQLGAKIECLVDQLVIHGIHDFNHLENNQIFCNESGSTLRFLVPLFSLTHQKVVFTGKNRLLKRPQKVYEDLFKQKGLHFYQDESKLEIKGALTSGDYQLRGDVSSQFISGLLFTLPLLSADSTITILPPFESRNYIELTLQMLAHFGIQIEMNDLEIKIKGNQHYLAQDTTIEGDFSQFAFFGVAGAINQSLTLTGCISESLQGDKQILDILSDFKVGVKETENTYTISRGNPVAHEIDLSNCPDLGPIVCVLACFSKGITRIYNASRLRLKESDRIEAMVSELSKMGAIISDTEDEIIIEGCPLHRADLIGWKDHRIVMALTIACSITGGTIDGCEAISKSYPRFFEDFKHIGGDFDVEE